MAEWAARAGGSQGSATPSRRVSATGAAPASSHTRARRPEDRMEGATRSHVGFAMPSCAVNVTEAPLAVFPIPKTPLLATAPSVPLESPGSVAPSLLATVTVVRTAGSLTNSSQGPRTGTKASGLEEPNRTFARSLQDPRASAMPSREANVTVERTAVSLMRKELQSREVSAMPSKEGNATVESPVDSFMSKRSLALLLHSQFSCVLIPLLRPQ